MKRVTKRKLTDALIYSTVAVVALTALLTAYTAIYFAHHDSPYAEGCPEQKTLLWCKR